MSREARTEELKRTGLEILDQYKLIHGLLAELLKNSDVIIDDEFKSLCESALSDAFNAVNGNGINRNLLPNLNKIVNYLKNSSLGDSDFRAEKAKQLHDNIRSITDLQMEQSLNATLGQQSDGTALEESLYRQALMTDGITKSLHRELSSRIAEVAEQISRNKLNVNLERSSLEEEIGELNSQILGLNDKLNKELNRAKEVVASIESLSSLTGTRVITGSYGDKAKNESDSAYWLRIGSFICLAATGAILTYTLYENTVSVLSWKDFLVRASAAIFWSIPAAYFAKESTRHREAQRKYENFFLSHEAILSLLHGLDEAERKIVYIDLAKQLSKASTDNSAVPVMDTILLEHQNKMFELMTRVVESLKK